MGSTEPGAPSVCLRASSWVLQLPPEGWFPTRRGWAGLGGGGADSAGLSLGTGTMGIIVLDMIRGVLFQYTVYKLSSLRYPKMTANYFSLRSNCFSPHVLKHGSLQTTPSHRARAPNSIAVRYLFLKTRKTTIEAQMWPRCPYTEVNSCLTTSAMSRLSKRNTLTK